MQSIALIYQKTAYWGHWIAATKPVLLFRNFAAVFAAPVRALNSWMFRRIAETRLAPLFWDVRQGESNEERFWARLFSADHHIFLEMVFANVEEAEIPDVLFDYYESEFEEALTHWQKVWLQGCIKKQLRDTAPLPGQGDLTICSTAGDGSCGLHALLGENQWGTYRCDADAARQRLVDWIRDNNRFADTPLRDYFLRFDQSPHSFQRAIREVWEQYRAEYLRLYIPGQAALEEELNHCDERRREILILGREVQFFGAEPESQGYLEARERLRQIADADGVIERFVNDERVRQAYLDTLRQTHVWLLQDELALAAECFNKRVRLFQPGWHQDSGHRAEHILNPGGAEEVAIYYNGFTHYERAYVNRA